MKFGSLFSGIGGMDLGLERAGMQCAWQVEIDEYATKVLAKHWATVPRFRDVRECGKHNLETVDLICGGFPCQDISEAGRRAGITGTRSGLWFEFYRIISELRPRFVLVENVSDLLRRGIGRILSDLSNIGYDTEWETISACSYGAPHTRERVFVIAYPGGFRPRQRGNLDLQYEVQNNPWREISGYKKNWTRLRDWIRQGIQNGQWDEPTPSVCRMADGIPNRVDRLRGLGNAVVPAVAQWIGERIMDA